jgi:non-ribosomal peptide synthetase component F
MHHIVSDAWSMEIIIKELHSFYEASISQNDVALDDLPIQYKDYACWQRDKSSSAANQESLRYLTRYLSDAPNIPLLRTDRERKLLQDAPLKKLLFEINEELTESLEKLAASKDMTLFMLMIGALGLSLIHYNGYRKIIIGTDTSGRENRAVQNLVGLFVNQFAICAATEANLTIDEYLNGIRNDILAAHTHREVAIDRVVSALDLDRSKNYSPLFQTKLSYLNKDAFEQTETSGLHIEPLEVESQTSKIDLMLIIGEDDTSLRGAWEFNSELFTSKTIESISNDFNWILKELCQDKDVSVDQLFAGLESEKISAIKKGFLSSRANLSKRRRPKTE